MKKSTRSGDTRDSRPAATPDIPGVSDIPDDALPDINTLSLLAAQPRFFNRGNDTDALRAALAVWREAKRLLDRERKLAEAIFRRDALLQSIKSPKDWSTATFAEFLHVVVQGKDKGEQLHRFRRFWLALSRENKAMRAGCQTPNEGPTSKDEFDEIEEVIANLESAHFMPRFVWEDYAVRFGKWWGWKRRKRNDVAEMPELPRRGTRKNLRRLLDRFSDGSAEINHRKSAKVPMLNLMRGQRCQIKPLTPPRINYGIKS